MNIEYIAVISIYIGILLRILVPAIRKWSELNSEVSSGAIDKAAGFKWSQKYTIELLISLFLAYIVTAITFPLFIIPEGSMVTVVFAGSIYGWGQTSAIDELFKWYESRR